MNKLFLFVLALFFTASMFFACDKQKTFYELEKEERKAISRFINENDFVITDKPTEMYNENVYFKTKDGLYINVIDSGNGNKARYGKEEIIVRYDSIFSIKGGTEKYAGNTYAGSSPYVFIYGNSNSYYNPALEDRACEGWAIGLSFVSENARVNLIIPSILQPTSRQSSFLPLFYENLYYRFK